MRFPIIVLSLAMALPAAAKTYRWVDENGRVHYGDHIPAKYAQQEAQQINERGVVVDERNRPMTEEERAAQRERERQTEEARRAEEEQARYDQFLLSTYSTRDQIILRRDEQLTILDARIESGEKSVLQSQATLDQLNKRAENFTAQNKPVPAKLAQQIQQFEKASQDGRRALETMRTERERVSGEFERDLSRFLELSSN